MKLSVLRHRVGLDKKEGICVREASREECKRVLFEVMRVLCAGFLKVSKRGSTCDAARTMNPQALSATVTTPGATQVDVGYYMKEAALV